MARHFAHNRLLADRYDVDVRKVGVLAFFIRHSMIT